VPGRGGGGALRPVESRADFRRRDYIKIVRAGCPGAPRQPRRRIGAWPAAGSRF